MGRKKKFGEESDFVSVRVPKSKRKEYRNEIKKFVEKKFIRNSITKEKKELIGSNGKNLNVFKSFEEFVNDVLKDKEEEKDIQDTKREKFLQNLKKQKKNAKKLEFKISLFFYLERLQQSTEYQIEKVNFIPELLIQNLYFFK